MFPKITIIVVLLLYNTASTTDNTLRLTYNESVVPINVSFSAINIKEAAVSLNETIVQADAVDFRTGMLEFSVWNTGESAGEFSVSVQCGLGILFSSN
jgi:hypothetical protein